MTALDELSLPPMMKHRELLGSTRGVEASRQLRDGQLEVARIDLGQQAAGSNQVALLDRQTDQRPADPERQLRRAGRMKRSGKGANLDRALGGDFDHRGRAHDLRVRPERFRRLRGRRRFGILQQGRGVELADILSTLPSWGQREGSIGNRPT